MVDKLSQGQVKFLTALVMFLLAFCTFLAGWAKVSDSQTAKELVEYKAFMAQDLQSFRMTLPEKYVPIERYKADCDRDHQEMQEVKVTVRDIDRKIDRLLSRRGDTP